MRAANRRFIGSQALSFAQSRYTTGASELLWGDPKLCQTVPPTTAEPVCLPRLSEIIGNVGTTRRHWWRPEDCL
jgi:hypothetical protein